MQWQIFVGYLHVRVSHIEMSESKNPSAQLVPLDKRVTDQAFDVPGFAIFLFIISCNSLQKLFQFIHFIFL